MSPDALENLAALYVSGAMTAPERDSFEVVLEYRMDLRAQVAQLQEAAAQLARATAPAVPAPSSELKARILANLGPQPSPDQADALVVAGPDGCVQWVNPAFTAMCGYTLNELHGRRPGSLLQGQGTDPQSVARIRKALAERRSCREEMINYHKNGSAYSVDVSISPILDDEGAPLFFVARERQLAEPLVSGV